MAPKPTPEVAAIAKLLFQAYMEENAGKRFQQVLEPLTGYQVEVTSLVQAMVIEYCRQNGETTVMLMAHNMSLGAWLARKHAEHTLAHLAKQHRGGHGLS